MTARAPIASPVPREMSFARTSRFASTKFFVPIANRPTPQFEVPVVMPKVWLPKVPLRRRGEDLDAARLVPEHEGAEAAAGGAVGAGPLEAAAVVRGERGGGAEQDGESDHEAHAYLQERM